VSDQEDQETPVEEVDAEKLAEKTAWVNLFLPESRKRGHRIEHMLSLFDEPGMTVEGSGRAKFCLPESESRIRPKDI